ncbi:MAG: thiol-disulfide oxidoreductase DCC family protein [Candidatus Methylumidiphilus sp.]
METSELTVLFDGGCPLCSREIAHYRKLASLRPVAWLDVAAIDGNPEAFGVSRGDALAQFHVRDADGRWHVGADGFVLLWQALPYYRWLAWVCLKLHLLPLLRRLYGPFARWHYRRRCAAGVCG